MTQPPKFILESKNLTVGYKHKKNLLPVLTHLNLTLEKGKLCCLLGANGVGKSTLLRTLVGLQQPLAGNIALSGRNMKDLPATDIAKQLSLVLTELPVSTNLSVFEIVALGRYPHTNWQNRLSTTDRYRIYRTLVRVGLQKLKDKKIKHLSDGQKQKVMIARALAQEGALLVLDEPTAHLDVLNRTDILFLLRQIAEQEQKAVLVATHELALALQTAHELWLITSDKKLHSGMPEQLVLEGHFARNFSNKQIFFDNKDGTFKLNLPQHEASIALTGDAVACFWTKMAIEKNGFAVNEASPLKLQCIKKENSYHWTCQGQIFEDLKHLLYFLCNNVKM
ncbi:MAG: ABC transporter ATP-binding protein [Bernardetiaceae bacterium]|nr:ABC transporter ATP-binding protein [Bernardetiaceae bacterium]